MHCSIWTWSGDPDALAAKYEALVASLPPEFMQFAACARTPDGIIVFDTCASKDVFDEFSASDGLREAFESFGLGAPASLEDHPVAVAYALGRRIDTDS